MFSTVYVQQSKIVEYLVDVINNRTKFQLNRVRRKEIGVWHSVVHDGYIRANRIRTKFPVKTVWHACSLDLWSRSLKLVWTGNAIWVVPSCKAGHLLHYLKKKKGFRDYCNINALAAPAQSSKRPDTAHYIDSHRVWKFHPMISTSLNLRYRINCNPPTSPQLRITPLRNNTQIFTS